MSDVRPSVHLSRSCNVTSRQLKISSNFSLGPVHHHSSFWPRVPVFIYWVIDWLIDSVSQSALQAVEWTDWLTDWLNEWMNEWMEWMNGMTDYLHQGDYGFTFVFVSRITQKIVDEFWCQCRLYFSSACRADCCTHKHRHDRTILWCLIWWNATPFTVELPPAWSSTSSTTGSTQLLNALFARATHAMQCFIQFFELPYAINE